MRIHFNNFKQARLKNNRLIKLINSVQSIIAIKYEK